MGPAPNSSSNRPPEPPPRATGTTSTAVWAALAGNLAVAAAKIIAAALTGSAAMASEAVHSLVDSINELLLLYGISRSTRPADEAHPLGYAREVYFWSFVVALLIFTIGTGVSAYEGIHRLEHPQPIGAPLVSTVATILTGDSRWDGIASLAIALILAGVAMLLARESKALLIGERADPQLAGAIIRIASGMPGVCSANSIVTVQLAPANVVATLSLDFFDYMRAPDIERAVVQLEDKIRAEHPEVSALFVKPQSVAAARSRAAEAIMTPDDVFGGG